MPPDFYDITQSLPPSPLLLKAIPFVSTGKKAMDIGAGALKDSRYLLGLGFDVMAIDRNAKSEALANVISSDHFRFVASSFQEFDFPNARFDLVTAMFALPFCRPSSFPDMWNRIRESIVPNGIFCGQFFGIRDAWSMDPNMTFHDEPQARELFRDMDLLLFHEEEKDGTIANGTPKHWHVFHVIARKQAS